MASDDIASAVVAGLALAGCQVADGYVVQDPLSGVAHGLPALALRAEAGLATTVGLVQAGDGRHGALEHRHHLAQLEVVRLAKESVAPLRTADAPDEAGPTQGRQELVQVGLRDAPPRGGLRAPGGCPPPGGGRGRG